MVTAAVSDIYAMNIDPVQLHLNIAVPNKYSVQMLKNCTRVLMQRVKITIFSLPAATLPPLTRYLYFLQPPQDWEKKISLFDSRAQSKIILFV